jgi:hypothetical protein
VKIYFLSSPHSWETPQILFHAMLYLLAPVDMPVLSMQQLTGFGTGGGPVFTPGRVLFAQVALLR